MKFYPSPEQEAVLHEMYWANASYTRMGEVIGHHRNTLVRVLYDLGLKHRTLKWTPEKVELLKRKFDEGLSAPMIAKQLGFTDMAVRTKWKRLGLKRSPSSVRRTANFAASIWTKEKTDELCELWDLGFTGSQIAQCFGDMSRCAILGKVHRLKLSGRHHARMSDEERLRRQRERYAQDPQRYAEKARKNRLYQAKRRGRFPIFKEPKPLKLSQKLMGAPEPTPETACTMLALTPRQCRWVIGEPRGFDTLYCGAVSVDEQSYCGFHYHKTHTYQREQSTKKTSVYYVGHT